MIRRVGFWAALVVLTGAALFLRVLDIGNRPFHADESVHAFKLWDLYAKGRYVYDPDEFHGPTLYYAAEPILAARHRRTIGDLTEADCRLAVAVLGALIVPALALFMGGLSRRAILVSAALVTLSPALTFYSRYFIQEVPLVLFTALMLGCWWRYSCHPSWGWAVACGAAAGLMIASKETAVLAIVCWLVAIALARAPRGGRVSARCRYSAIGVGVASAIVIGGLFLSGMGRNPSALTGYLRAFTPWMERAHATDLHAHHWAYYLRMLTWWRQAGTPVWTEALALLLALVGILSVTQREATPQRTFARRLAVFTAALLAVYSAIPYKTPWCVLSPLFGLILCAGVGGGWLLNARRPLWLRISSGVLIAAGLTHLGWLGWLTSFRYQVDPRNPYVYAQTVPDAIEVQRRAEALAAVHPDHYRMVVKVFWNDAYYWPIPWYLRRFENVGYWQGLPANLEAPLIFASPDYDEELTAKLDRTHLMNGYIGLRPRVLAQVWVGLDLWTRYIESRPRPVDSE